MKDQNELRIRYENNVKSIDARGRLDVETILQRHDEVFKGIGKIYDKKNGEEFLVKFSMKSEAAPIAQKPRPVPYYLKDKDYCPIEIIKGLTDKGQFQYLTKLMGPQVGNYLYTTQFLSLR